MLERGARGGNSVEEVRPYLSEKYLYKYPHAAYPYADLVGTEAGNIDDEFSANRIGIVVLSMLVAGPRLNRRIKYRHRPNAIIGKSRTGREY
jgi:hypothetical protein